MKLNQTLIFGGLFVVVLVISILLYSSVQSLDSKIAALNSANAQASQGAQSNSQAQVNPASAPQISFSAIAPKGVPVIYGKELGVSYDDISTSNPAKADETIKKLGAFDDGIKLEGDLLQRYIRVAGSISCEYCCGAPTIIDKNGNAACGCAHSYAMRGLGKYLLKYHAKDYTDVQLLEELGKWKVLFFPGPMTAKASAMVQRGATSLNYIDLASNKYRGIENQPVTNGTSGASTQGAVAGGAVTGAASQVGGC